MPIASRLKLFYLLHFSQPSSERLIYQTACRNRCRRILEIGVDGARRAQRLLQATAYWRNVRSDEDLPPIDYIGVDLFEAGDGPALKDVYRLLRLGGAKVRLLPGDPPSTLARWSNEIGLVDLLLLSSSGGWQQSPRFWYYVPRLITETSIVMVEHRDSSEKSHWEQLGRLQIDRLKKNAEVRRAA